MLIDNHPYRKKKQIAIILMKTKKPYIFGFNWESQNISSKTNIEVKNLDLYLAKKISYRFNWNYI